MKTVGTILLVIVLFFGLSWLVQGNGWFMYRVFAPRYERTRRQVFEQTYSYQRGMVQELRNMQAAYETASPEHKAALRSIILHRVGEFPDREIPGDLANFINELRRQK